jgi:hypothetical protein
LPVTFALKAESQDPVLGIVPLAAVRTRQKRPEMGSLAVVVLGNGKCRSTAAGNQEHRKAFVIRLLHRSFRTQQLMLSPAVNNPFPWD